MNGAGGCYPGREKIARVASLDVRTVLRHLPEIEAAGLLSIEWSKGGKPHLYAARIPGRYWYLFKDEIVDRLLDLGHFDPSWEDDDAEANGDSLSPFEGANGDSSVDVEPRSHGSVLRVSLERARRREMTKTMESLTDSELEQRRDSLALDARVDPALREDLEAAESEMARRVVATKREEAAQSEARRRVIHAMTDRELDHERARLGAESPTSDVVEERGWVIEEQGRREAQVRSAAKLEVPGVESRVSELAAKWQRALEDLRSLTEELRGAIVARSSVRGRAFGEVPRWSLDEDRMIERAMAVLGGPRHAASARYRTHSLGELI
ncbi:MAG: hypothetical protein L0206_18875 [Actinobacteria bacterium]|nr:hypothetical protein [Actinomycetota bacterium]